MREATGGRAGSAGPPSPASQVAPDLPVRRVTSESLTVSPACDEQSAAAWRRYVRELSAATVFHEPVWTEVIARVFGHRGVHLLARRGPRVVGVLPLVEVRSLLGGTMLVSVPYGTYGGILCDDDEARDALADQAVKLVHERGARVLDLRSAAPVVPNGECGRPARVGWEPVERYDGFVRDLPLHPNEGSAGVPPALERFLPRHARAAVRQAREREGIDIQHDNNLLPLVWRLYSRSMRRLGSINYPQRFFAELAERLGDRMWVTVAWHRKRPAAGLISFVYQDTVMPFVVGLDERVRCYGASNLLYFSVMERAVRAGLRRFDFGRSRKDNTGPARFKRNQGFKPRTLGYQRYVPPGQKPPDLSPSNRRFDLARRAWRHLPLPLTRQLGGWLAKSLPG